VKCAYVCVGGGGEGSEGDAGTQGNLWA